MTPKQRRDHKIGNQIRKAAILKGKAQHYLGGVPQDSRYTPGVLALLKARLPLFGLRPA